MGLAGLISHLKKSAYTGRSTIVFWVSQAKKKKKTCRGWGRLVYCCVKKIQAYLSLPSPNTTERDIVVKFALPSIIVIHFRIEVPLDICVLELRKVCGKVHSTN
ncbi:hypothetical protein H5410_008210 [Solanum commersonii]|uniref:Uncharacterized protein n=1 Tax=Solanum commersonii TaxID=4109 RepID=A0A9J6AEJ7_SOLCO|nr:hypothetical protein H5410_008210 [Solanum commersonii]